MNKISLSLTIAALLMFGCGEKSEESNSTSETLKQQAEPETSTKVAVENLYGTSANMQQAGMAPEDAAVQTNAPHVAKVVETMNSAGYTYVKVDENGNIYWIAGPETAVNIGSTISYIEQMVMQDFTSKSLNRKFDYIMFAGTIIPSEKSASADTAASAKKDLGSETGGGSANASKNIQEQAEHINIAKLQDGYSVEEMYTKKSDLQGKEVKLKAQVVKVSKNIMGKDWVHLQDGTGGTGTNDIIATAVNSTVQVGDVVTVQGMLKTDVDLGYGYFFPVILEESKFTN